MNRHRVFCEPASWRARFIICPTDGAACSKGLPRHDEGDRNPDHLYVVGIEKVAIAAARLKLTPGTV